MKLRVITILLAGIFFNCLGQNLPKKGIQLSTGINMKYVEVGSGTGQVVIMLHGYTDTSRSFFDTVNELTKLDPTLKIYALDQRGHGESSMPPTSTCAEDPKLCFSPRDFADDVIAFMDSKKISRAFIVGHSMGSIIAQEVALEFPNRVQGMVLIGSWVNSSNNGTIKDYLINTIIEGQWKNSFINTPGFQWPKNAYQLKPSDLSMELTEWIKNEWVVDPIANDELISAIYPETMNTPIGTWIGVINGLAVVDNTHRLKNLSVNTLVLWATQDSLFPIKDQQELMAALDAAALKNKINFVFKVYGKKPLPASGIQENDLGHNLQWAAFEGVAEDIHSFIKTGKTNDRLTFTDESNPKSLRKEYTSRAHQRPGSR